MSEIQLPPLPSDVVATKRMEDYAIAYARAAVLAERERCAKLAEQHSDGHLYGDTKEAMTTLAAAIRKGE